MNPLHPIRHSNRGFSIVELIAVMVVLAVMVPTTLSMVADASRARHGSSRATTAATFAASLAEHLIADTNADDPAIGFEALAEPATYLNAPNTGLRQRLGWLLDHHAAQGYSIDLDIGPLISADGNTAGDPTLDLYRRIVITINWSDPATGPQAYRLALIVGDGAA